MRNQAWDAQGVLNLDQELSRVAGVVTFRDYLANITRPATPEEVESLVGEENLLAVAGAKLVVKTLLAKGKANWTAADLRDLLEAIVKFIYLRERQE